MSQAALRSLLILGLFAGCTTDGGPDDDDEVVDIGDDGKADGLPRSVSIKRVWSQNQLPIPLASGAYQIHNIDVGTGLSVLVRGTGFAMLFDGGSGDDKAGISSDGTHNGNRLIAYLFGALGPSGPASCTPDGDHFTRADRPRIRIDHLVLSHSHDDHVSLLPDVIKCYDVANVWEPGAVASTAIYEKFVRTIAAEPAIAYHTAAAPPASRTLALKSGSLTIGSNVTWTQFVDYAADQQVYKLNKTGSASFKILHADGTVYPDANQNSVVVRLDLGSVSMLLVGDAESGERKVPLSPVGDVEKYLMDTYPTLINVDIHQAGHHGSMTSNRDAFLRMVTPALVLIGAGPKRYGSVVLPDQDVIDEYVSLLGPSATTRAAAVGDAQDLSPAAPGSPILPTKNARILRTDQSDAWVVGTQDEMFRPDFISSGCVDAAGNALDRIGVDDGFAGGCDNYVIKIPRTAASSAAAQ